VHRFFAPALDPGDEVVGLPREEAEHLTRVLRLGVGDTVAVFDGRGREFLAKVSAADRREVKVQLLSRVDPAAEATVALTLAQAVLKGDKMEDVIRDATMMGVSAIEPLVTAHSTVRMKALSEGQAPDRWRRIAVASAKQCRRAVLPVIGDGMPFEEWVMQDNTEMRLMLVEPSVTLEGHPVSTLQGQRPASSTLLVGPEGGWAPEEIETAVRAGWVPITLGRRTLRADAVAVVAIGVLQFVWADL
jgi:16S rRNA (uracil1498-N3)-methyltransferase